MEASVLAVVAAVFLQLLNYHFSSSVSHRGVRLVDKKIPNVGTVEKYYDGRWHLVCAEDWSEAKANVTCRTLGYSHAVKNVSIKLKSFELRNVKMMKMAITCVGTEWTLGECENNQTNFLVPCLNGSSKAAVNCSNHDNELCLVCSCGRDSVDCSSQGLLFLPWLKDSYDKKSLRSYILRKNKIVYITKDHLPFYHLTYLDLSENNIEFLPEDLFEYTPNLTWLDISENMISNISSSFFQNVTNLKTLNISKNKLSGTDLEYLDELKHLELIVASDYIYCCYVKERRKYVECSADENTFSGCRNLIQHVNLRGLIWVILVFTLLGNLLVLVTRFFMEDKNVAQKVLIMNLGVSDVLMGIYLTIIVSMDLVWRDNYFHKDKEWRASYVCRIAGILAMMSSQASLFTLVFITYDRFRAITNVIKFHKLGPRSICAILATIWVTSLVLSIPPAIIRPYFYKEENKISFYGTNSLCLPLQLPHQEATGWEYCFALFGGVNLVMSIYITVAYVCMFISVRKTGQVVQTERIKQERTLAKRMLFIVVTDLLCWFPVIIVIYLSYFGLLPKDMRTTISILTVCVIPINSALNPILYTIFTPSVLNKINALFGRK